jgi:5-methylcytosine-specific restriction protein A
MSADPDALPGFTMRDQLGARSRWRCEIHAPGCTADATDWHHRQRRREGDDTLPNALHACRACHRHVHTNPGSARAHGWIVSAWSDPATTPVRCRGRWVLLTPDGSLEPTTERP